MKRIKLPNLKKAKLIKDTFGVSDKLPYTKSRILKIRKAMKIV